MKGFHDMANPVLDMDAQSHCLHSCYFAAVKTSNQTC